MENIMTTKQRMYEQIENHGAKLNAIFNTPYGNVELCKKLRRLEVKAHRLATDYCNGENGVNNDNWDRLCNPILKAVEKVLGMDSKHSGVFINGDARGYALKIEAGIVKENALDIYQDWGGYGILAPEFNGK